MSTVGGRRQSLSTAQSKDEFFLTKDELLEEDEEDVINMEDELGEEDMTGDSESTRKEPWVVDGGCFATCTNFGFDMPRLYRHLKEKAGTDGTVKTYSVGKEIDVMYTRGSSPDDGHIFYFASGATVFWGIPEEERNRTLSVVQTFGDGQFIGHQKVKTWSDDDLIITHDFECKVVPGARTKFRDDTIVLQEYENIFDLLAISYGLAQSTQLSMFETTVADLIEKTGDLPSGMIDNSVVYKRLSLARIKRLTAELLDARYNINIRSDILDTPYFLWDNSQVSSIYEQCIREVSLQKRHQLVNTRLGIMKETLELLNNERQNHIGHNLEKYIILLIAVEIVIEVIKTLI
eukprot:CAMPEP_0114528268 /NCGR_PEP_ID=MMETSP0109-20121206/24111_1 /TAXON_ID=29199 /ORGANISM="Chlorarachnion reptans, Strain CCCM449" /LENGTH=347 /DNA_ID=CAMNT_0001710393 /DNA_START=274 /DNA_END=1317 /DNA_ORIENTATION=-